MSPSQQNLALLVDSKFSLFVFVSFIINQLIEAAHREINACSASCINDLNLYAGMSHGGSSVQREEFQKSDAFKSLQSLEGYKSSCSKMKNAEMIEMQDLLHTSPCSKKKWPRYETSRFVCKNLSIFSV